MNDIAKIKEKIKKLLSLSKSPNSNEAASAMALALELMGKYNIEVSNGDLLEVAEEEVETGSGQKPPLYEVFLIQAIARGFGCRVAYGWDHFGNHYTSVYSHTFVGIEHRVKVAAFMADVLMRKLKKARRDYIKTLKRVRIRENKIKRADSFCRGWVAMIRSKINDFTNSPDEEMAIEKYVGNLMWPGNSLKTLDRDGGGDAVTLGYFAASDVKLQHGVEGQEKGTRMLHAPAEAVS
jgi:hypothetical protein